ncbi:hypothetical protein SCHPADRAFT_992461 [Schizopora paradoxa]|uniref:Vacuolar ATPase assembly integral membrane protein VMA21 n=1 Tax=Schizopora paradoxa TaxID=27342 RepID=A0A0H2S6H6_9AGAM|nr:hypothetical protein SCHPADRAFT_992461 [Schizopora paradoxa]
MSGQAQVSAAKAADNMIKTGVVFRLVTFAVALGVVPIATFYGTKSYFFNDNSTYAAIAAVTAANVVLVTYIVQSVLEDRAQVTAPSGQNRNMEDSKKSQ